MSLPTDDVFAQADAAEEAHQVAADGGVVVRRTPPKKLTTSCLALPAMWTLPKKTTTSPLTLPSTFDAAEEADRVVDGRVGRHLDVGKELDGVAVGARGRGGSAKAAQARRKAFAGSCERLSN